MKHHMSYNYNLLLPSLLLLLLRSQFHQIHSFTSISQSRSKTIAHSGIRSKQRISIFINKKNAPARTELAASNNKSSYQEREEEARLNILTARRKQIRSTLRSAEKLRNYRITNGYFAESKEEQSAESTKAAVGITAFFVAIGAIVLRVGGRAALVSAIGLDFTNENPELQSQLQVFLDYTNELGVVTKGGVFLLGWCFVKVFCFDLGGVVLALSSGILFDNVLLGALLSAGSATVGSMLAFLLAKVDTPIRKKALELMEEYPSLRGIDKVVAKDGIKAILTLRLAPILPIPIGMYNYVYGITNVPISNFAIGIFLGSLKPYLLDSYLGYFGKTVLQGSSASDTDDVLLLVVLGVSILIGVFASQLATETWESVQQEVEIERKLKEGDHANKEEAEDDDGIVRNVMGLDVPEFAVGMQLTFQEAINRLDQLIDVESHAQVWNYTNTNEEQPIPKLLDPAYFTSSPEIADKYKGLDIGISLFDGFTLGPVLLQTFLKYSDPSFLEEQNVGSDGITDTNMDVGTMQALVVNDDVPTNKEERLTEYDEAVLLSTLSFLRNMTLLELDYINSKLDTF